MFSLKTCVSIFGEPDVILANGHIWNHFTKENYKFRISVGTISRKIYISNKYSFILDKDDNDITSMILSKGPQIYNCFIFLSKRNDTKKTTIAKLVGIVC